MFVAITGATGGIGKALVRRFDESGDSLLLMARDEVRLLKTASGCRDASFRPVDMSSSEQIDRLFDSIPVPDVWINNAGLARGQKPLDESSAADIEAVLNTNLLGAMHACRRVSAGMRSRGSGHIVNITSAAASNPYRGGNSYAVSKAGLHMLTQCLRHDLGGTAIRVSEIAPGIVGDTDFVRRRFDGDMSRYEAVYGGITTLSSDDVAAAVHYCVSAPAHVNIDLLAIFPVQQHGGGVVHRPKKA